MALATLAVTAEGSVKDWTKVGGLSVPATMNSDDGNTSYFNNDGETGLGDYQYFTFDPMPGGAESISTHTGYFKAAKRSGANKTVLPGARFSAVNGYGANEVLTVVNLYVLFSRADMKTATPTVSEMNSGELLLGHAAGATGDVGWTYAYWTVTYLAGGSKFKWLLAEWIPPLLGLCSGAGLLLSEIYKSLKTIQGEPMTIADSIAWHKSGKKRIMPVLPSNRQELEMIKDALLIRKRYCFIGR